jgi:hypothetical protein
LNIIYSDQYHAFCSIELVNLFIRYFNSYGIYFLQNRYIGSPILEFITLSLVVGAIAELSHTEANIERIKTEDGLVPLIKLINTNGPELLVNVSRALGECANNKDALERMRRQDGVRLLWSLLKHSSEQVQVCILAGLCVLSLSGQAFYHIRWLDCVS